MVALLGRLRGDRGGGTVLENAAVLPVFFLLVMMVIETAWQCAVVMAVDHGARRGARWVSLGTAAPNGLTRAQYFAQMVITTSGLPLDPSKLSVTPTAYASYAALGASGAGTAGLGGPDQVVRYVVNYQSQALTPLTAALIPTGWLQYRSVVIEQNEPYPEG